MKSIHSFSLVFCLYKGEESQPIFVRSSVSPLVLTLVTDIWQIEKSLIRVGIVGKDNSSTIHILFGKKP